MLMSMERACVLVADSHDDPVSVRPLSLFVRAWDLSYPVGQP